MNESQIGGNELAKVLHYYDLMEGNDEFKIVCPFHDDVNASMKINLGDGSFYCFGCGVSGDALKFVSLVNQHEWIDDLQVCKVYHRILKSKKVKAIFVDTKVRTRNKNADEQALTEASDYYHCLSQTDWVWEDGSELQYMKARGFTPETLNKCRAKINYSESYPIIFPMLDNGIFKGWVCRTMNKRVEAKRKYLYNKGFSRRNTLVGDYANSPVVVLVEGYMDRLKMIQLGSSKVVAILGWKITQEQIEKLKKAGVKTIISALDNDECGRKGTAFLRKHFDVIRFKFPEGVKDPGEMNKKQFDVANKRALKIYRRNLKWQKAD